MSGGSYDYNYLRVEEYYVGSMYDKELDDLMKDLVDILHDLEWWQSGDISEKGYRETVKKFKNKWFVESRDKRLKKYINDAINETKYELIELLKEE